VVQKFHIDVFNGNDVLIQKTINACSLDKACYSESIIAEIKKALNVQVLNHSYRPIHQGKASAAFWLANPKTGKNMFQLEVKIVS